MNYEQQIVCATSYWRILYNNENSKNDEPRYYFSSTSPISIISQYTLHSSARIVQITNLNHRQFDILNKLTQ